MKVGVAIYISTRFIILGYQNASSFQIAMFKPRYNAGVILTHYFALTST